MTEREKELEDAIRWVVTQQADDLCWMDAYTKLAALVGVKFDPKMLPKEVMLRRCDRYIDSLLEGCPYATDEFTEFMRQRQADKSVEDTEENRPKACG
jgi:hypothetical protein